MAAAGKTVKRRLERPIREQADCYNQQAGETKALPSMKLIENSARIDKITSPGRLYEYRSRKTFRIGVAMPGSLFYATDGDRLVVTASKSGADSNPDWYYNLLANPTVTVELGTEQFQARATPGTEEPERSRLYAKMVAHRPGFAGYEQKTSRPIPAIILERGG